MDNNADSKAKNFATGPSSHMVICPHCGESVRTKVDYKPTTWTYVLSCLLCPILCCCLPCCCGCFFHIDQSCPSCKQYLGTYKRKILKTDD
ncbi:unnamed protein product [Hermetia illucens]|uniref:LITAF domain-containing protein n=1 Tax=Hermetia illucens TaxID=343691 RepID=A0A7R8YL55_HERIL|nr:unnamed protein product [Hermetia illucens]